MIKESSVFIIGYYEQACVPMRRIANCLVNILQQIIPAGHIVHWMLGVASSEFAGKGMIIGFYENVGFRELRICLNPV